MTTGAEPGQALRQLVLLGAGHAHVHVLQGLGDLAGSLPADVKVTVVSPWPRQLYSGMVPGFVAGHYELEQCLIPLDRLLARSGASHIADSCVGIDADVKTISLASGQTLRYDWLSVNTGPVMDRARIEGSMPGASEHALFVRPIEAFGQLWPRVVALGTGRAIHIAVVGAGAAGLELAMAAAHALRRAPFCAGGKVSLVTGGGTVAENYPAAARRKIVRALAQSGVAVIRQACVGMNAGEIILDNGQHLACDAPLLAVGAQAPGWLAGSGLALDPAGFMEVNQFQQSTNHDAVFAAGDIASRVDAPHSRSGVYAVRAGPPLLANLLAAIQSQPLQAYPPARRTLNLLSCGERYAIAIWGGLTLEGRWVWRLKDWIDRKFVAQYL